MPLFFADTGLRASVALLNRGVPWRDSFVVGVLVNTRGLVELVILNVGLDLHILSRRCFR